MKSSPLDYGQVEISFSAFCPACQESNDYSLEYESLSRALLRRTSIETVDCEYCDETYNVDLDWIVQ